MRKFLLVAIGVSSLAMVLSAASSLQIRVAPTLLVLSSGGGNVTVHTNARFFRADEVQLEVDGTEMIDTHIFPDDRGFLVVQCSKEEAGDAIGEFKGKFTTAEVRLTVDGSNATEVIRVRK